jgi:hypothetical protein
MWIDLYEYAEIEGFRKIDFILRVLKISVEGIATLLEIENLSLLKEIIRYDPQTNRGNERFYYENESEIIREKLYLLIILFNYLLKMSNYETEELRNWWNETNFFDSAVEKPPWYPNGLCNYLAIYKYQGLKNCIEWIKNN